MTSLSFADKLQNVINSRRQLLPQLETEEQAWGRVEKCLKQAKAAADRLSVAKGTSPELRAALSRFDSLISFPQQALSSLARVQARCSRDTINIGVGGAGRMGKSTLLQSITGLGELQIPTSNKYFTTAIRSQIVNSEQGVAIADFHDETSFLKEVVVPLCRAAKITPEPDSLDLFLSMRIENSKEDRTQKKDDAIGRLRDTQAELPSFRRELRGERGRRIPLSDLRPYVAYPEGGALKSGRFQAVSRLVIHAPFPENDVRKLQVMDLPGLGEAGIDMALLHTRGMEELCDLTLLLKRPTDTNVAWTDVDSTALDAMRNALKVIEDQTQYTIILANVGGMAEDRASACVEAIKRAISRPFTVLPCDAKDTGSVRTQSMPRILEHLAEYLPEMDRVLLKHALRAIASSRRELERELDAIQNAVKRLAPQTATTSQKVRNLAEKLQKDIAKELDAHCGALQAQARGADDEWCKAIDEAHGRVKQWIQDGCGHGSKTDFQRAIEDDIRLAKGQPNTVINAVRVGFREQWDLVDVHLRERIASSLDAILSIMGKRTGEFVPRHDGAPASDLEVSRRRILAVADKFESDAWTGEDKLACPKIAACLRRLAEVELTFRFHLEPLLHAATRLLLSTDLPRVSKPDETHDFTKALAAAAEKAADEYARALKGSGAQGSTSIADRVERVLKPAGTGEATLRKLREILTQGDDENTFRPNRILSAVAESFYDAMIRSRTAHGEFHDWAESWRDEIWPNEFNQESDSALVKNLRAALKASDEALKATGAEMT